MLSVSRNDIVCEEIVDYNASDRFLKLPIQNYLKLLPSPVGVGSVHDNINRPQIALINAINNPKYRFVCAALARRLGKTFIANVIAQMVSLVPNSNVLIMSPNYSLSTISFELQRKLIKTFDLEITRDNLKDKVIELSNGSTVRMGSISQVDSCVGRSYSLILMDESALSAKGKDAFEVALRPTLDTPNSKAIFISTPRGKKNWFSEYYSRGYSLDFPQWVSIHADYTENDRMSESDVMEARRSMSKAEFEQEYMASFNVFEGQVYSLPSTNIVSSIDLDVLSRLEFFAGIDPGFRDPTAVVVIGYDAVDDVYYIVEDYLESEATTSKHAEKIQALIDKWNIDSIFIDSAAAQFASDLAYEYDIATAKSKKDILPGIAYVQSLVENGKVFVLDSATNSLETFDQYQWDGDENLTKERTIHNKYSHTADAIRYALYTFTA